MRPIKHLLLICATGIVLASCGTLFLTVNTYVSDERSYETSKANTQEKEEKSDSKTKPTPSSN